MSPKYDTKITANFKSYEYRQNSKYVYFKIVVEGKDPITKQDREYKSEWLRVFPPKDFSKTFTVYIDSKNSENYLVDVKEFKKYQTRHDIFWFIIVPWSVALIGWIASLFLHTK